MDLKIVSTALQLNLLNSQKYFKPSYSEKILHIFFEYFLLVICLFLLQFCLSDKNENNSKAEIVFYLGADLSYVNEMENCGVLFKNKQGAQENVFEIFSNEGANLLRVRLWHNPTWTAYLNYTDVEKTIKKAKN